MKKITKKYAIELLGKASSVKNVLCGYIDKEKADIYIIYSGSKYIMYMLRSK